MIGKMMRGLSGLGGTLDGMVPHQASEQDWTGLENLTPISDLPPRKQAALSRSVNASRTELGLGKTRTDIPGYRVAACHRWDETVFFAGVTDEGRILIGSANDSQVAEGGKAEEGIPLALKLGQAIKGYEATANSTQGQFRGLETDDWTKDEGLLLHYLGERIGDRATQDAKLEGHLDVQRSARGFAYAHLIDDAAGLNAKLASHARIAVNIQSLEPDAPVAQTEALKRLSSPGKEDRVKEAAKRRLDAVVASSAATPKDRQSATAEPEL